MTRAALARETSLPLCVDLDGTLIRSNLLLETLLRLVKANPLYLLLLPVWLMGGRANLKAQIAARVPFNPATLPYDGELIQWLQAEHTAGRSLWLCTAAHEGLASQVAAYIGLFDGVVASDQARKLVELFGEAGFDYCGNERRDLALWQHAHGAIIVHGSKRLALATARVVPVLRTFPPPAHRWRALLRALRPHQWAKNALVVIPLLAGHHAADPGLAVAALLAVVAFCLCASSVYVLNDLLDLEADRQHSRKSRRPFAAGELSIATGLLLSPCLLALGLLVAFALPAKFVLVFGIYYALTLGYSFFLKNHILVDTLTLAGLYTVRILAGAAATGIAPSFWLLLFSVFLFLSLAFVKRFAELDGLRRQQQLRASGRNYHVEDLSLLRSMGTASGYMSVLVLALYINSPEVLALYHRPKVIWLLCVLLLYWVSRIWIVAQRGKLHDDPVVYALRDPVSILTGLLAAITVILAV
jgi:4-hydroxybenzoate polyprenyltransferase